MSAATAAQAGVADGDKVTVATDRGSVTVPVVVVPMIDDVVWLPTAGLPEALVGRGTGLAAAGVPYTGPENASRTVRTALGAGHGAMVTLRRPE
jgi:NADH-quinone oxidoreductase subunit G